MAARSYLRDALQMGFCVSGVKAFCLRAKIDYQRWRKEGYEVNELEHIDDVYLQRVLDVARKRNG